MKGETTFRIIDGKLEINVGHMNTRFEALMSILWSDVILGYEILGNIDYLKIEFNYEFCV